MEFIITNSKKYLFITSAVLLMLCSIFQGLPQAFLDNINFNYAPIKDLIFAISYGYVLYIFITYFNFYSLRTLSILTKIILALELIGACILILKSTSVIDLSDLRSVLNTVVIIIEIIWLCYLLPLKNKDLTAISLLCNYGISIIVTFFLAIVVMFNIVYSQILPTYGISDFILAIPYAFLIYFGINLKSVKDETAST